MGNSSDSDSNDLLSFLCFCQKSFIYTSWNEATNLLRNVSHFTLQCLQNPWKWPEDWKDQAPSQGLWNLPGNNHICYQFTLAYKHYKCSAWITFVHREFVHRNLVLTFAKFEKNKQYLYNQKFFAKLHKMKQKESWKRLHWESSIQFFKPTPGKT